MYRSWFEGVYQKKNLIEGRIEFEDDDGPTVGLHQFTLGQELYLHVFDGITQAQFHFPCCVVGIRFSNEVWYDIVVWHNESRTVGSRVNRIRGENLSTSMLLPPEDSRDLDAAVVVEALNTMLVSGTIELESEEDILPALSYVPECRSYYGKKFYVGTPHTSSTKITRLFIGGTLQAIANPFKLGDLVEFVDHDSEGPGVLAQGRICEIHVEDEFYYSVAIPIAGFENHSVVLSRLDVEDIRLVG